MASYVLSDLHGQYDLFCAMLEKINFGENDKMYILGDIVDRGAHGIKILEKCMQDKRITLLLGNHEDIMLKMLDAVENGDAARIEQLCVLWWRNGGENTARELFALSDEKIKDIEEYLYSCPLCVTVNIGHNKFLMAHACPISMSQSEYNRLCIRYALESGGDSGKKIANYRECLLWQRVEPDDEFPDDVVAVFGHTPTAYYQKAKPYKIWSKQNKIAIDCGLSSVCRNNPDSRLACLRLDDKKAFYLSPYDFDKN